MRRRQTVKRRLVCAVVIALVCAGFAGAQDKSPFAFDIGARLLGADVGIGYQGLTFVPGAQTTIWAYLGGGYEWMTYYRTASGTLLGPGDLAAGSALAGRDPGFVRIEGAWRLGLEQGFVWNPRTSTNLVEAFAFYRGRADSYQATANQLLSDAALPDRTGMLLNVLQAGLAYDDLFFDVKHKTRNGIAAEVSVEWGPSFFLNTFIGDANYVRLNASARAFLPVYDIAPGNENNLLSVYAGDFVSVDYAAGFGAPVPIAVRQTFGGRDQFTGLGHAVRGVDSASLDTNFKAVNNLEVRANLPALFVRDLVPGVVVFVDAGCYAQVGESGVTAPVPAGFVASTGAGVYVDLLDLASLAAYVDWRLDSRNADGSQLTLLAIEFGMHF
jgi:hypothetical protein